MQEKNPLDDIDIDSLIKTHNVKPVSSGVDPWAGFDTPTDTLDKTIAEQTSSVPGYRRGGSGEGLMNKIAGGINEFTGVGDLAAKAGQAGLNYLAKRTQKIQLFKEWLLVEMKWPLMKLRQLRRVLKQLLRLPYHLLAQWVLWVLVMHKMWQII